MKFVRTTIDRYYANEPMDDLNKILFAFAAYNAGPGRVRQLRREAAARGLDLIQGEYLERRELKKKTGSVH